MDERFEVVEDESGKWLWPRWVLIDRIGNVPLGLFATEEEALAAAEEKRREAHET